MTDWTKLAEPFDDSEVKQRPGAATYDHKPSCDGPRCRETRDANKHIQFSYVDARTIVRRLNDVVTPAGWEFTSSVLPGTDIVHGRLTVSGVAREDYGYPNSERDDEPIKAAASDALKRCAVLFGIGLHLYEDNKSPNRGGARTAPARPAAPARPSAPQRPVPIADVPEEPDFFREEFAPLDSPLGAVSASNCPRHDVPWAGGPGDYWHKDPDGKYCRHPDNIKRARAS